MEAATLQMMADLGLERRDEVSAPEEKHKSTLVDSATVLADVNARRAKFCGEANGEEGDRAAKLRAWYTEDTFERDEVTSQLEDRFSGQGHRANLNRMHQYDEHVEAFDARFGEERRLYKQEHGGVGRDYVATNRPRDQGRGAAPRSFSGGHNFANQSRMPPRDPNRVRAPSPRRAGTVRFGPGGQRIEVATPATRAASNPGSAAVARLRAIAEKSNQFAALDDSVPAPSTGSAAAAGRNRSHKAVQMAAKQPPRPSAPYGYIQVQIAENKALWYATCPGDECDKYYGAHPNELEYLGKAKTKLIREAVKLAVNGNMKEIKDYLDQYEGRKWYVESMLQAKRLVEEGSPEEIEAYLISYPRQKDFIGAAKENFAPKTISKAATTTKAVGEPLEVNNSSSGIEKRVDSAIGLDKTVPKSSMPAQTADLPQKPSNDLSREEKADSISTTFGKLTAAFYNIAGDLLDLVQLNVNAPVHAKLDITALTKSYDPRELMQKIETLAYSMVDRTQGLEGVRLADDGIWEEL